MEIKIVNKKTNTVIGKTPSLAYACVCVARKNNPNIIVAVGENEFSFIDTENVPMFYCRCLRELSKVGINLCVQ